jgi:hypothetical protein
LLDDPATQLLHSLRVQLARSALAVDTLVNQAAAPEDTDVAGDGLVRQLERFGEFAHRRFALCETREDCPAGPIPHGGEGGVQIVFRGYWHADTLYTTTALHKHIVE